MASVTEVQAAVERACAEFQVRGTAAAAGVCTQCWELPPAFVHAATPPAAPRLPQTHLSTPHYTQNPATQAAAEQVLLQFRRSAGVLPSCRHILEHSASPEARFHAACALREGLLREFASLPPGERAGLRSYVLQYVLVHAGEPALTVVRSILEGTLAVLLKRGWAEADEEGRAAFFQVCVCLLGGAQLHTGVGGWCVCRLCVNCATPRMLVTGAGRLQQGGGQPRSPGRGAARHGGSSERVQPRHGLAHWPLVGVPRELQKHV
jgi:hypothetical protein